MTEFIGTSTGAQSAIVQEPAPIIPVPVKPRRNRKSAKAAGSSFEKLVAGFLAERLNDDRIERRVTRGRFDAGDIAGVRMIRGGALVIEVKNYGGQFHVGPWLEEAERERGNADARAGVVVAKRRGTTDPAEQVVFMTLETLAVLIEGGIDL